MYTYVYYFLSEHLLDRVQIHGRDDFPWAGHFDKPLTVTFHVVDNDDARGRINDRVVGPVQTVTGYAGRETEHELRFQV